METEVAEEASVDVAEAVRVGLILVALALNVWIMWDYVKEQPQWEITRRRLTGWWHKVIVTPQEAAAKIKKMEAETVFEAIQVVDDGRG